MPFNLNDSTDPATASSTLLGQLNGLANQVKKIIGGSSWKDAPVNSLSGIGGSKVIIFDGTKYSAVGAGNTILYSSLLPINTFTNCLLRVSTKWTFSSTASSFGGNRVGFSINQTGNFFSPQILDYFPYFNGNNGNASISKDIICKGINAQRIPDNATKDISINFSVQQTLFIWKVETNNSNTTNLESVIVEMIKK